MLDLKDEGALVSQHNKGPESSESKEEFLFDEKFLHRLSAIEEPLVQHVISTEEIIEKSNKSSVHYHDSFMYNGSDFLPETIVCEFSKVMKEQGQVTVAMEGLQVQYLLLSFSSAAIRLSFLYHQHESKPYNLTIHATFSSSTQNYPSSIRAALKLAGFSPTVDVEADSARVRVNYAFQRNDGAIRFYERHFPKLLLTNIVDNYTPGVIEQAQKAIDAIRQETHGLVLLNGPVGTGKTHLVKSLLSAVSPERTGVICLPSQQFLAHGASLFEVAGDFDKSVIILEDIGDVLQQQAVSDRVDATSNLLNFTDGLLSLLANSIMVVTFNYPMSAINPAVLRPGRCLAQIHISKLPFTQVQHLLPKLANLLQSSEYSLAEVYEMQRTGRVLTAAKEKIGFRTAS